MAHLLTGDHPPRELITLVLCRDVWHCRPSELRQESGKDLMDALTCLTAEAEVAEAKKKT